MSVDRKVPFSPIVCKEKHLINQEAREGCVWFTTDSKRIYYSNGQHFLPMGGNSGIFYGTKTFEDNEPIQFSIYDIDGNSISSQNLKIPNIDDLILNEDGCFYRVKSIVNEIIYVDKLTIAGSNGPDAGGGRLVIDKITPEYITKLSGNDVEIEFNISATVDGAPANNKYTLRAYANGIMSNPIVIKEQQSQGKNSIIVDKSFLQLGQNTITIFIDITLDNVSRQFNTSWTVNVVEAELFWPPKNSNEILEKKLINIDKNFKIEWTVTGVGIEKTTDIILDDYISLGRVTSTSTNQSINIIPKDYGINHGAHKITLNTIAKINDVDIPLSPISKSLMFEETTKDSLIISCNFFETEIMQYDTIKIPYYFYKKGNVGDLNFKLIENDSQYIPDNEEEESKLVVGTFKNVKNFEKKEWRYAPTTSGLKYLTIRGEGVEHTLILNVKPISIKLEEPADYAFKFKASDFATNETVEDWKQVIDGKEISIDFSEGFDWINGGLDDEDDEFGNTRKFFKIKAGSFITFNYNLFKQDAKVSGKSFKFIFKATNCRDYDASVLTCFDEDNGGIQLNAQNAFIKGPSAGITVPYCEDTLIEFEFDISNTDSGKYITAWLEGIPAVVTRYNPTGTFKHDNKIKIGSNDCDVYIYLIKGYERHLDNEEHLNNFIADAPNATEMVDRFNRNDILDLNKPDEKIISPTRLAAKNPKCKVHVYEVDRWVKGLLADDKKDSVENCKYVQYQGGETPVLTANNVKIKTQGTSSASYGISAFNIDSEFTTGFVEKNNGKDNEIKKWAMTENSIPVNYFCTKVNVASSEHANNALNQEFYNRYQPYLTKVRKQNPKARDCMEFTPGVLFVLDKNRKKDLSSADEAVTNNVFAEIPGYVENPYARMYSICNMGNSKDNVEVFHAPGEYCIEILDNQSIWQKMQDYNYDDNIAWGNKMYFEFRYPEDGHEILDNTNKNKISPLTGESVSERQFIFDAWRRFMQWMATCNPQPKYKELIITSQEDFENFSKIEVEGSDGNKEIIDIPIYKAIPDGDVLSETPQLASKYEGNNYKYYQETKNIYGYDLAPLKEEDEKEFAPYTFTNSDYTRALNEHGSVTISRYAKKYTHDTYEYRMAKMLSQCEEYLVMDSVLYHYLFIERHSMVDNVAKNTFWSTEDGYHWNLTKNYDNDTADGNDNQGKLRLTYGIEPMDTRPNTSDDYYFNANDAVWLRFCAGLYEARKALYTSLDKEEGSPWDAKAYLKAFTDWQKTIPERCWIEDYYRKYIRPLEVYGDAMYLDMLEGGQKVHQRKQFETYQERYISSEYVGSLATENRIIVRATGDNGSIGLPISVYADCYVSAAIGTGNDIGISVRAKRGTPVTIYAPEGLSNLGDATVYFFTPEVYQQIGAPNQSLNILAPKQVSLASAVKLRTLIAGSAKDNFRNFENIAGESTDQTGKVETFFLFDNNELLETLHLCNFINLTQAIDLTKVINLKELDARNSAFSSFTFAPGAPIQKIYLDKPETLNMSSLRYLDELTFEEPDALKTLVLKNIDGSNVNSKNIVENAINLKNYKLTDIQWNIDNENELVNNNRIAILERLLTLTPYTEQAEETRKDCLTGVLNINTSVGSSNALSMYEHYAFKTLDNEGNKLYPNLDLVFTNENDKLYNITILDGNDKIIWKRKISLGNNGITEEFLSNGPLGKFNLENVQKNSSDFNDYSFNGTWKIKETDQIINGEYPYLDTEITQDITLIPIFTAITRQWPITIWKGTEKLKTWNCPAGMNLQDTIKDNYPEIPYKDDTALALDKTYSFKGYSTAEDSSNIITDLSKYIVKTEVKLYTVFEEKSVYDNIHEEYWDFTETSYTDTSSSNFNIANGYSIKPKKDIILSGKVTIPETYNNLPVCKIEAESFKYNRYNDHNHTITHIFIKGNNLREIGSNAFEGSSIQYFEFKEGLRHINQNAFKNTTRLKPLNGEINFGPTIQKIDEYAFNGSFGNITGSYTIQISPSIESLGQGVVSNLAEEYRVNIVIIIGDEGSPADNLSLTPNAGYTNPIFRFNRSDDFVEIIFYTTQFKNLTDSVGERTLADILGGNGVGGITLKNS